MNDIPEPAKFVALAGGIILGIAFLAACLFADYVRGDMRRAAIAHHAARYNPITGAFEWLDDVKDTK